MEIEKSKFLQVLEKLGGEKVIRYDLDRFRAALADAGNPEKNVYSIVISGTNGKGTTSLLVSNTLREAGYRVATYLSPHLVHPRERFLLNGQAIPTLDLERLGENYAGLAEKHGLSYFEYLTLLFFVWTAETKPDFMVLETGLGGRLDAVNVTDPIACIITNVDWDHMDYLGNSLSEILQEKMGILRPECLLFSSIQDPKLLKQLEDRLASLDGIYYYTKELRREVLETDWQGQRIKLNGYPFTLKNPTPGMLENAALSFLFLRITFPKIPIETLQKSFADTVNPGRFEIIAQNPRIVLSGDHNPAGIETLVATLKALKPAGLRILCGFSGDKPYTQMYERLRSLNPEEILLTNVARARSAPRSDYQQLGPYVENPREALAQLVQSAKPSDTIVVTGSLYLVGELRPLSA